MARLVFWHIVRVVAAIIAVLYFLLDILVLSFVRPFGRWVNRQPIWHRVAVSLARLNRWVAAAIFIVPWVLGEPVKPLMFYYFYEGDHRMAALFLLLEGVKMLTIERLWHLLKPKLLTFWLVATSYWGARYVIGCLKSLPVWQVMMRTYAHYRIRFARFWRSVRQGQMTV